PGPRATRAAPPTTTTTPRTPPATTAWPTTAPPSPACRGGAPAATTPAGANLLLAAGPGHFVSPSTSLPPCRPLPPPAGGEVLGSDFWGGCRSGEPSRTG